MVQSLLRENTLVIEDEVNLAFKRHWKCENGHQFWTYSDFLPDCPFCHGNSYKLT